MSNRRRVNISIDPQTYDRLQKLKTAHGFKNVCELVVACVNVLLDRMTESEARRYDLPEDDGQYIDEMFDDLSHSQRTPDGDVPVRHHHRSVNNYGER